MKRNKAAPCGGGLILSQQRGQHPQNGAEEAAYPGVAEALLQRHRLAAELRVDEIPLDVEYRGVVVEQHRVLKVEEHTAVVQIDRAYHSTAVVRTMTLAWTKPGVYSKILTPDSNSDL